MKLRNTIIVLAILIVAILLAIFFLNKKEQPAFVQESHAMKDTISSQVSKWTLEEWIQWRDNEIVRILSPTFISNNDTLISREDVIKKCAESYTFIEPYLNDSNFFSDPAKAKELRNFTDFVKAQNWMSIKDSTGKNTHALGTEINDKEYWNYVAPEVAFPDIIKSQNFLKLMTNSSNYKNAIDLINLENKKLPFERQWKVYPFRARFIKSVDNTTYGRMLVLIPREPVADGYLRDKWILFSIATPDLVPEPEVKSVSIISVKYKPSVPGSNKAYLTDFMREKDSVSGDIRIVPTFTMEKDPSKNCYDCHKSAVLPIYPENELSFDLRGKMMEIPTGFYPKLINFRIKGYGISDFGPQKIESYGPSIGPDDKERITEFIASVTKSMAIDSTSYPKIINAMDCASCHNSFAKINYLQAVRSNRDVKAFKTGKGIVQTYIEQGWMPPKNNLTPLERSALWKCLMAEYFDPVSKTGVFVDWLKGK